MVADKILANRGHGIIPDEITQGMINICAGLPRQTPGLLGDLAGLPGPHPTGQDSTPQPRQPVPHVQRISNQGTEPP
jgi:hypothetical protein